MENGLLSPTHLAPQIGPLFGALFGPLWAAFWDHFLSVWVPKVSSGEKKLKNATHQFFVLPTFLARLVVVVRLTLLDPPPLLRG